MKKSVYKVIAIYNFRTTRPRRVILTEHGNHLSFISEYMTTAPGLNGNSTVHPSSVSHINKKRSIRPRVSIHHF